MVAIGVMYFKKCGIFKHRKSEQSIEAEEQSIEAEKQSNSTAKVVEIASYDEKINENPDDLLQEMDMPMAEECIESKVQDLQSKMGEGVLTPGQYIEELVKLKEDGSLEQNRYEKL